MFERKKLRCGITITLSVLTVICLVLCCAAIDIGQIRGGDVAEAVKAGAQTVPIGDIVLSDYTKPRPDNNVFDGEKMNKLYARLLNNDNATYETVKSAAAGKLTAANIRANNGNKLLTLEMGKDASGNSLVWNAVYLSTNRDGDPILTLWMAQSSDTAQWNKYSTNTNGAYPSNMYGNSYIRTEVLNNTGTYYTNVSGTGSTTYTQTSTHKYAKFTSPSAVGSFTDFIDEPAKVEWQEKLISHKYNKYAYDFNNDAYGNVGSGGGDNANWYSGMVNYFGKGDYSAWQNDKLWLPAMADAGWHNATENDSGLWQTSELERGNASGVDSWLRSAG